MASSPPLALGTFGGWGTARGNMHGQLTTSATGHIRWVGHSTRQRAWPAHHLWHWAHSVGGAQHEATCMASSPPLALGTFGGWGTARGNVHGQLTTSGTGHIRWVGHSTRQHAWLTAASTMWVGHSTRQHAWLTAASTMWVGHSTRQHAWLTAASTMWVGHSTRQHAWLTAASTMWVGHSTRQHAWLTAASTMSRFWKMATTFTGLKLQGQLGKFGRTELTDIAGQHSHHT